MKRKDYYIFKMDLDYLNIFSIIFLIILLLFNKIIVDYSLFNKLFQLDNLIRIVLYYFLFALIHEVLHAISYIINGGSFKKIVFGIMLEKGILYCLCKQNISKRNILISLLAPFVIIGICTYVIGIYFDIPILVLLSIANMSGCVGDIAMFNFISKLKNIEFSEFDDPTSFAIYSSNDVSKYKHYGLKFIEKRDSLDRKDLNKIVISRFSILFILFVFIICFF